MLRTTVALLIFAAACSSFTDPDREPKRVQVLGTIAGYNGDDPQIRLSRDGRTLTVQVDTYGNGCYSKGQTRVAVEGLQATISPYDSVVAPGQGIGCVDALTTFTHEATVEFDGAGTARVLVHGVEERGAEEDTITVERLVEVP